MIEVNNLTGVSINRKYLIRITKKVLRGEKIENKVELSIALVGPGKIREINRNYRGRNKATDVLSFSDKEVLKKKFKPNFLKKVKNLGEIVICPHKVKENARKFGSNFKTELAQVLIHGILHLLGYEDEKSAAKVRKMEEKQQYYLSKILKIKP